MSNVESSPSPAAIRYLALTRAGQYVARLPAAVSGENGHNQTFAAAIALVHGFALSESDAWPILLEYNRRCDPPWSDTELRHKLKDATDSAGHKRPPGYLLTRFSPGTQVARARSIKNHSLPDLAGLLGQVRLRGLPELTSPPAPVATPSILNPPSSTPFDRLRAYGSDPSDAGSAILDPPSSILSSSTSVGERRGPTIQLPRAVNGSLQGFIDPRIDPERQWLHIRGYSSIPPRNCPTCWLQRGRSLWIGLCHCSSATLT